MSNNPLFSGSARRVAGRAGMYSLDVEHITSDGSPAKGEEACTLDDYLERGFQIVGKRGARITRVEIDQELFDEYSQSVIDEANVRLGHHDAAGIEDADIHAARSTLSTQRLPVGDAGGARRSPSAHLTPEQRAAAAAKGAATRAAKKLAGVGPKSAPS